MIWLLVLDVAGMLAGVREITLPGMKTGLSRGTEMGPCCGVRVWALLETWRKTLLG